MCPNHDKATPYKHALARGMRSRSLFNGTFTVLDRLPKDLDLQLAVHIDCYH